MAQIQLCFIALPVVADIAAQLDRVIDIAQPGQIVRAAIPNIEKAAVQTLITAPIIRQASANRQRAARYEILADALK